MFRYRIIFAEEQVDELQAKITRLQEHVLRLSSENENLKHQLGINVHRHDVRNANKVTKLGTLEAYEGQDHYQVSRTMLIICA